MKLIILLMTAALVATPEIEEKSGKAKISSDTSFYDRQEGIIVFTGNVYVDDAEYQLHSDRAFVFLEGTNDLKRIVATGNVALTNLNRRAYGDKVTYRRDSGLVVLYGAEGNPATITETTDEGERTLKGRKVRFWVDKEQVEVEGSEISAPTGGKGMDDIKSGLLKR